ncbi:hypothetical protein Syun_030965 [Stephania yunnanensis]|uniref:Protein kinase domain-containing protein n=1 Tax=Stephania yunnanensis TaxID=152371 RepID=A0AAP0E3G3_9MAGN
MVAYVGDFGQAKILERNRNDSGTTNSTGSFSPGGTVGYIPPEYGIGVNHRHKETSTVAECFCWRCSQERDQQKKCFRIGSIRVYSYIMLQCVV